MFEKRILKDCVSFNKLIQVEMQDMQMLALLMQVVSHEVRVAQSDNDSVMN